MLSKNKISKITRAVINANLKGQVGGKISSKDWVVQYFLPELEKENLQISNGNSKIKKSKTLTDHPLIEGYIINDD